MRTQLRGKIIGMCVVVLVLVGAIALPVQAIERGKLAYLSVREGVPTIYLMDVDWDQRDELTAHLTEAIWPESLPAWSPDGHDLAFVTLVSEGRERVLQLEVLDTATGETRSLVTHQTSSMQPLWSPDGTTLMFTSSADGGQAIYIVDAVENNVLNVTAELGMCMNPDWSPDGSQIAASCWVDGTEDVYFLDVASGTQMNLTQHAGRNAHPAFSPDGSSVAFVSDRTGYPEIFLINLADGETRQVTNNRSEYVDASWAGPVWSQDGEALLYLGGSEQTGVFAVTIAEGLSHQIIGSDSELNIDEYSAISWSPDGQRVGFGGYIGDNRELFIVDVSGQNLRRLTYQPGQDRALVWMPVQEEQVESQAPIPQSGRANVR